MLADDKLRYTLTLIKQLQMTSIGVLFVLLLVGCYEGEETTVGCSASTAGPISSRLDETFARPGGNLSIDASLIDIPADSGIRVTLTQTGDTYTGNVNWSSGPKDITGELERVGADAVSVYPWATTDDEGQKSQAFEGKSASQLLEVVDEYAKSVTRTTFGIDLGEGKKAESFSENEPDGVCFPVSLSPLLGNNKTCFSLNSEKFEQAGLSENPFEAEISSGKIRGKMQCNAFWVPGG